MSEMDEQPVLAADITAADDEDEPKTLADQLRLRRQEIAESRTVLLPMTGYEEYGVVVQHRLMDRKEVEKIGRKILAETRDRGERNMRILLDTIINSTTGFYLQELGKDPEEIKDDRKGDAPVLTWPMFAYYLGWEPNGGPDDSRSALEFCFGFNEFSIGQYGIILNRWMGNTGVKIDEEFLGEVL